jgi:hypothetical protein
LGSLVREGGSLLSVASSDAGFDPTAHKGFKFASNYCLRNNAIHQYELAQMITDKKLMVNIERNIPIYRRRCSSCICQTKRRKIQGQKRRSIQVPYSNQNNNHFFYL